MPCTMFGEFIAVPIALFSGLERPEEMDGVAWRIPRFRHFYRPLLVDFASVTSYRKALVGVFRVKFTP